jgi:hypothetical protein
MADARSLAFPFLRQDASCAGTRPRTHHFEHFWNDFAADPTHSVPERDRRIYAKAYARRGGMRAGFRYFRAFEKDAEDFARFAKTPLRMPMLVLTGEKASGDFLIQQGRLVATNVEGRSDGLDSRRTGAVGSAFAHHLFGR